MEVWVNGIPKVCGKWYVGMELRKIMGELNYKSMWEWNYVCVNGIIFIIPFCIDV